ncbi:ABC transporter permease [Parvimonas micra]|uniref:ABC transporter permease n=1 Tax=Parvimonas micra TaxID=33033 RepID=UPI00123C7A7B|nr:ABC transporter permease subunit [Parvimonas micra]
MNRVFKYDGFKLQKSKFWWICTLITMALTCFSIFSASALSSKLGQKSFSFSQYRIITNPTTFIFLIIVCIFIGSDFKTGTIKNVASKGIKRPEIVLSKLIWNFILAIAFMILSVLSGLIAVILFTKTSIKSDDLVEIIKLTAIAILALCAFASIFTLISFMVKSSGAAIAISIIVSLVLNVIVSLLETIFFKSGNLSRLFPFFISNITGGGATQKSTTIFIIAMFVWIIVCSVLSILFFQKQDIK